MLGLVSLEFYIYFLYVALSMLGFVGNLYKQNIRKHRFKIYTT